MTSRSLEARRMLALLSVCGFLTSCSPRVLQIVTSPDGSIVAEVRETDSAGATDANSTWVVLETNDRSKQDHILEGTYYEGRIRVSWVGPRNLLIACENCPTSSITRLQEKEWNGVSVRYDLAPTR